MIRMIKTRRSTLETLSDKIVTDNWLSVYEASARMEGRRIYKTSNTLQIIYTEKDYTITFIY